MKKEKNILWNRINDWFWVLYVTIVTCFMIGACVYFKGGAPFMTQRAKRSKGNILYTYYTKEHVLWYIYNDVYIYTSYNVRLFYTPSARYGVELCLLTSHCSKIYCYYFAYLMCNLQLLILRSTTKSLDSK